MQALPFTGANMTIMHSAWTKQCRPYQESHLGMSRRTDRLTITGSSARHERRVMTPDFHIDNCCHNFLGD